MDLELLGAGRDISDAFTPYAAQGFILARVALSQRDRYRLVTEAGELDGEPSGGLWHRAADRGEMPVVGDWVAARAVGDQAIVEHVLPRRTLFARRAAGKREDRQPIAANIDVVFLVCGLDGDFNLRRLERYRVLAVESGARAVVVLNKADVAVDLAARISEAAAVAGGSPVVACSAARNEGLEELMRFAEPGTTVALLGSSGVGKSSIVNRLLGEERFRTAEVRAGDSRGRHTTTHRELAPLPAGGALIDTPGMRELQLWASEESVDEAFDEIAAAGEGCRYRDCSHSGEAGCAVEAAVADGGISAERWESYRKLLGEARHHERMTDRQSAEEYKRKCKEIERLKRRFEQRHDKRG
jgi:ribosome biogenesis GTPase / thiamine phosphate phosphatase